MKTFPRLLRLARGAWYFIYLFFFLHLKKSWCEFENLSATHFAFFHFPNSVVWFCSLLWTHHRHCFDSSCYLCRQVIFFNRLTWQWEKSWTLVEKWRYNWTDAIQNNMENSGEKKRDPVGVQYIAEQWRPYCCRTTYGSCTDYLLRRAFKDF